jgi:NAD(P)-dependent dehydrogenase (short-subunit alcohol dehydrogenase family)
MNAASRGLDGRCALVTAGARDSAAGWVQRLRDEGLSVVVLECDLGSRASCDGAVEQALQRLGGRIDVLVTAPSRQIQGSIEATSEADFRDLLETNLTAMFRITRACFEAMRAQNGGSIINVASDAGIRAAHEAAAYSVSCAAVVAASELFAAEGAPYGIRSNAVCPRAGTDVTPVIAWLASDESSHVSGATLRIDDAMGAAMTLDTRT